MLSMAAADNEDSMADTAHYYGFKGAVTMKTTDDHRL
ncbi:hypothetical protein FF38_11130 [Lucilia cuprina]|uniref:Uncharacterized protein n=1 Tax=Lucilia cuprina TaxID=7375 RepID=A0A0L0BXX3_LUCCU|nr:hypothetical protein CVS40_5892 [Lucilia cuprina]KNC24134.1 hypothetical protein FF38_11130 [Lucilia cuprina]